LEKGIFYGVSVGPGDPELITLKAINAVRGCEVIAAPKTRGGDEIALDILSAATPLDGKEILRIDFAMTRDPEKLRSSHEQAAAQITEKLAAGKNVAMPNLGDVSVFSTYCYIADLVREKGYEAVAIPGVTSFCASAAKLGVSLTTMNEPLHIIPAGGFPLEEALSLPGRKVLMKAGRSLAQVKEALRERGLYDRASLVENCGLPGEKVCPSLDDAGGDTGYFATIIVK